MVRLGEINPIVWDKTVEILEEKLKDIHFNEKDATIDWRIGAASKKFDRNMFEEYGHFKDIILHPTTQYYKQWFNDNISFDFQLGEPLLPVVSIIILLTMARSKVSQTMAILLGAFLFNLNPVYVVLVALFLFYLDKTNFPKGYSRCGTKISSTKVEAGQVGDGEVAEFDHIIIGNNIGALFSAAILAVNGRKCCVLMDETEGPVEVSAAEAPCAIPIGNCTVGKVYNYQKILDFVQSWDSAERCHFVATGSRADDYTSVVLHTRVFGREGDLHIYEDYCVVSQEDVVATLLRESQGADITAVTELMDSLRKTYTCFSEFVISRMSKEGENFSPKKIPSEVWMSMAVLSQKSVLEILPEAAKSSKVSELIQTLVSWSCGEYISLSDASAVSLAAIESLCGHGLYFPRGGPSALAASLQKTILQSGGRVITDVFVDGIDVKKGIETCETVDQSKPSGYFDSWRATGVRFRTEEKPQLLRCKESVVSCSGILRTYYSLLPRESLNKKIISSLSVLRERRPLIRVLYWTQGTSEALDLVSSDYAELLAGRAGDATARLLTVSSPSAKDPTWATRYGSISTVVVEWEASSEYVTTRHRNINTNIDHEGVTMEVGGPEMFELVSPEFSAENIRDIQQFADQKLADIFPKCSRAVICSKILPIVVGGHCISQTRDKYSSSLSCHSHIQGLYLGSKDLTGTGLSGEIQGGWIAAHAALGFAASDLDEEKTAIQN